MNKNGCKNKSTLIFNRKKSNLSLK